MKRRTHQGFTLIEVLITVSIIIALAAIAIAISRSMKEKANQVRAMQKLRGIGTAFSAYVAEHNGMLPLEDAAGTDDWSNAAKPESQDAWYNALPKLMNAPSVGEIGVSNPSRFYDDTYPLYIPGAPYPSKSKRESVPMFAVGMNSRLQRKSEEGIKTRGMFSMIIDPPKTVIFLERGMPNDKKTMSAQRGFDASPKANPRAFAARHSQKGALIFADGHVELHAASELLTPNGSIIVPQTSIVWTMNPETDPN